MRLTPIRSESTTANPSARPRLAHDREISVIVPTLNEAMNLPALLSRVDAALAGRSYEIILVDDGSQDETRPTCAVLADRFPLRLIVRRDTVGGLSGAVLHGMALAHGRTLVVMDADLQHPPEAIADLLAPLDAGDADFVLGSRYAPGGKTEAGWGRFRKLNSLGATCLARPIAGRVYDPMSGFFAIRAQTYRSARQLAPMGYKIALELMCKCRISRIVEVPIHFGNRTEGESKLSFRQQARFLRHLSRLYAFAYPKCTAVANLAIGAFIGWAFANITNPQLALVLAPWAAITSLALTRQTPAPSPDRNALASAEVQLRESVKAAAILAA